MCNEIVFIFAYFEGLYYERYYHSITILFSRERKKNKKTDILGVLSKRKKKLLFKKIWICERR
jgi:hypothetical protein